MKQRTLAEPYKIKMVEPIKTTTNPEPQRCAATCIPQQHVR